MNTNTKYLKFGVPVLALWLAILACSLLRTTRVGDLRTETQSVDLGGAGSAKVTIEIAAGVLKVEGGADQLMHATFRSNVAQWQPQVAYSANGGRGELAINHHDDVDIPIGKEMINEWMIQLNNAIPLDLEVFTGAGESNLNLGVLDLSTVRIDTGAGITNVDLRGNWSHDLTARVTGGVGELHIKLPADLGVRVNMETAIVSVTAYNLIRDDSGYVNRALGSAPHTLTLDLQAGVGSVFLEAP